MNKLRAQLKIIPMWEVKTRAMDHAIAKAKGDIILAAALLGIGKTSLYRYVNSLKKRRKA